jgi:hypothetical protein
MRYTVTKQRLDVLGRLWMPNAIAATSLNLSSYDLENIEDPQDRESVEQWLMTHSGGFSQVLDFRADFHIGDEHIVHEWSKGEDSEMAFNDCMYPVEEN